MANKTVKISPQRKKSAETQLKEMQTIVKYDIRDFVIGYLVEQFQQSHFFIPPYQREYIWHDHHRWTFIESILLGLPIPMMFVAEIEEDGRLEVVDGAQRINTLEAFVNNDLKLQKLQRLKKLNDFCFSDLSVTQQNKFRNKPVRIVVLDTTTTVETRKEIFRRVNTTGEKARPSEVRRGAFEGPFMSFIDKCSKNKLFKELCPVSENARLRREPQELVLRFFAYSDRYKSFKHDVEKFLDEYVIEHKNTFDEQRLKTEFDQTMRFVSKYFPHGFTKTDRTSTTPRVRFEAISVGVVLALRKNPTLIPEYPHWLESAEFRQHTTTHASNSRPKLKKRVEYVRDMLLNGV